MKNKILIGFDRYDFDQVKKDIAEANDCNIEDIVDSVVWDTISDLTQEDWDNFFYECKQAGSNPVVVTGYFMSWMGPQHGGKVYSNLVDAVRSIVMDDSTPIFSFDNNGVFVLNETHHDAPCSGNHYEFKILTDKGSVWYNNHKDILDRQELCEHLRDTKGLSRNIDPDLFGIVLD